MTLDDLVYKFEQTYNGSFSDGQRDIRKAKLLGIRAVVEAMRDEMAAHFQKHYTLEDGEIHTLVAAEAVGVIDEILASNAKETP